MRAVLRVGRMRRALTVFAGNSLIIHPIWTIRPSGDIGCHDGPNQVCERLSRYRANDSGHRVVEGGSIRYRDWWIVFTPYEGP